MSGINKVILIGRLARDVDMKYSANGNAIANISLATSETWKDKNTGDKKEKSEFHSVVIFGKLAEIAQQYLTKGSQVYLEGKLQTRKWQDKNTGQDRYSTEVVIDFNGQMQMLGGGPNSSVNNTNNHNNNVQNQQVNNGPNPEYQQAMNAQAPNGFDTEDVPFSMKATSPYLFMLA